MALPAPGSASKAAAGSKASEQDDAAASGRPVFDAFPYPPYGIQQDFMQSLYELLSRGGVGLFESPTGTGKTLSLICGTLKWLEDVQQAEAKAVEAARKAEQAAKSGLPSWMASVRPEAPSPASRPAPPAPRKARKQGTAPSAAAAQPAAKGAAAEAAGDSGAQDDFLLEEWHSDSEEREREAKRRRMSAGEESSGSDSAEPDEGQERPRKARQVYFCSRTHSQLSQFVGELRRTRHAASVSLAATASRQTLCINERVRRLGSAARVNEACLDLQRPGKARGGSKQAGKQAGCTYLRRCGKRAGRDLQARLLASPTDVEELARLGSAQAVCPYYAARAALPAADVVLLPYSALLVQETREALGVRLEGAVVIVDEAHNLASAVHAAHSAAASWQQLLAARAQLRGYHARFQARLAPGNEQNLQTLLHVADSLLAHLAAAAKDGQKPAAAAAVRVNDFLFATGLDTVNLFRLVRYAKEARVAVKVAGYADWQAGAGDSQEAAAAAAAEADPAEGRSGALQAFLGLLAGLTNADADGRVVTDAAAGSLKFTLLNAARHFAQVLEPAHAVVLASGTLAPVAALQRLLFPDRPLSCFSCGHVVPPHRLLALALGAGPAGRPLDFRHPQRSAPEAMDQLARLLLNACQAVPQGVVVFFPSFSYCEAVAQRWQATGDLQRLAARKRLFREPRGAAEIEPLLRAYAAAATAPGGGGALLLCVVGGRLSEGINFGDGLGRCVVVVGMPFPNAADPELGARVAFMQQQSGDAAGGREFYEDLCMKAVNQCIGRVLRHAGDWAAVLLADARWAAGGPCRKLPAWMQASLERHAAYGPAHARLARFCRAMAADAG